MIELCIFVEIEEMCVVGWFVVEILVMLCDEIKVGMNFFLIDCCVYDMICKVGVEFCYIDYYLFFGVSLFGKVICMLVNDVVLYGLFYDYVFCDGDLVMLDFVVLVDGWVVDFVVFFVVGMLWDEDFCLIDMIEWVLMVVIQMLIVGNWIGDIFVVIVVVVYGEGYLINIDFGGYGVGCMMYGDFYVVNDGCVGCGFLLCVGFVFVLELWFFVMIDEFVMDFDGWILCSVDGLWGVYFEYMIVIIEDGLIILIDCLFFGVD